MKKSKVISLVLISGSLAACHTVKPSSWDNSHDAVYWDGAVPTTSAAEEDSARSMNNAHLWLWNHAFRSYRSCRSTRGGVHGSAHGTVVARTVRGGFGKSFSVGS